MEEEWRNVVGYEGWYQISSLGRVKRIKRAKGAQVGRILRPGIGSHGYPAVMLSKSGTSIGHTIHELISRAFLGPLPAPGYEVNHKDTVRANSILDNLEYLTRAGNAQHAAANGRLNLPSRRIASGNRHGRHTHPESTARGARHGSRTHPECVLRGEAVLHSKLSVQDVRAIRALYATGEYTLKELAAKFGVTFTGIHKIVKRQTWASVTDEVAQTTS